MCAMAWNIQHEANGEKGRLVIKEDDEELGQMTYVYAGPQKIIIDHTEVDDRLKGQGAGKALVDAGADFAREQDLKILPLCPFAKRVMTGNRERYGDVLV